MAKLVDIKDLGITDSPEQPGLVNISDIQGPSVEPAGLVNVADLQGPPVETISKAPEPSIEQPGLVNISELQRPSPTGLTPRQQATSDEQEAIVREARLNPPPPPQLPPSKGFFSGQGLVSSSAALARGFAGSVEAVINTTENITAFLDRKTIGEADAKKLREFLGAKSPLLFGGGNGGEIIRKWAQKTKRDFGIRPTAPDWWKSVSGVWNALPNLLGETLGFFAPSVLVSAVNPLAGAVTAFGTGFASGFDQIHTKAKELGMSDDSAVMLGMAGAIPYAWIEKAKLGGVLRFGKGGEKALKKAVVGKLATQFSKGVSLSKELVKTSFVEGLEEVAQEGVVFLFGEIPSGKADFGGLVERLAASFVGGFSAGGVLSGANIATGIGTDTAVTDLARRAQQVSPQAPTVTESPATEALEQRRQLQRARLGAIEKEVSPQSTAEPAETAPETPTETESGFRPDPEVPVGVEEKRGGFISFGPEGKPKGPSKPWLDLERTKSPNKVIEDFFQRTNTLTSVKSKLSQAFQKVKTGLKERFIPTSLIPRTPEGIFARDAIRTMPEQIRAKRERSIDEIETILNGDGTRKTLDHAGLDLLRRKVFTEDLIVEGIRAEEEADLAASAGASESDVEFIRGRRFPEGLTKEFLQEEKARIDSIIAQVPSVQDAFDRRQELWERVSQDLVDRGVISEETARNKAYVRHFVLDFVEDIRPPGVPKSLKKPFRASALRRKGTSKDISTDYLEVELNALGQIFRDNAVEDLAGEIADFYSVGPSEGVPPGFTEWQFKRGNIFFQAKTITEAQITAMAEQTFSDPDNAKTLQIPLSAMRDGLVIGGKRKTHIIPQWLADQLDDLPVSHQQGKLASLSAFATKLWKRWILRINPIRYNLRNFVGDAERVNAAGKTGAFLRVPDAAVFLFKKQGIDYEKGLEFGAFGSSLWHEMGDATELQQFKKFKDVTSKSSFKKALKVLKLPFRAVSVGGQALQDATQAREDVLRVAVYLDALDSVDKFLADGTSIRHWAGKNTDIEVLAKIDKHRAATRMSRETLGDYGDFTPWENDVLRNGVVPFYSWMKINVKFWPQVLLNSAKEEGFKAAGKSAAIRAGRVGYGVGKFAVRIGTAYAMLAAWNNSDEDKRKKEKALPSFQRFKPHVILKDGIVSSPSALSDFLEWFDLESIAPLLRRWENGHISFDELLLQAALTEVKAPVNRVFMALNPFLKTPITLLGARTFPDVFESRPFAKAFSKKAVARAFLDLLGSDVKRFVDVGKGKRTLQDVLAYYFSGSSYRRLSEDDLLKQIRRGLEFTTIKRRTDTRQPGDPRKGREGEAQELQARHQALTGRRFVPSPKSGRSPRKPRRAK